MPESKWWCTSLPVVVDGVVYVPTAWCSDPPADALFLAHVWWVDRARHPTRRPARARRPRHGNTGKRPARLEGERWRARLVDVPPPRGGTSHLAKLIHLFFGPWPKRMQKVVKLVDLPHFCGKFTTFGGFHHPFGRIRLRFGLFAPLKPVRITKMTTGVYETEPF